jgi:hypothetical protein
VTGPDSAAAAIHLSEAHRGRPARIEPAQLQQQGMLIALATEFVIATSVFSCPSLFSSRLLRS